MQFPIHTKAFEFYSKEGRLCGKWRASDGVNSLGDEQEKNVAFYYGNWMKCCGGGGGRPVTSHGSRREAGKDKSGGQERK